MDRLEPVFRVEQFRPLPVVQAFRRSRRQRPVSKVLRT